MKLRENELTDTKSLRNKATTPRRFLMKTRACYFGGVIVVTPVMVGEVEPASRIRIPGNPGNQVPK